MSSIRGAILNVIPTKNKHITSNKNAVAIMVHLAFSGSSSESSTYVNINYFINY